MKRILILMLIIVSGTWTVEAQKTVTLEILHSSDTHSRIEPLDKHANSINAGQGGSARQYAIVNEYRKTDPDLLLLDCGDISQGTPYYNLFQGELEIKLMNLMKYDAMTIGNHEFDFGLDNMARLFKMANFPVVCANYDCKGTVLENLVKPYIVLKRKGVKIGIFGLSPQLDGLVQAAKCEGLLFLDPVEKAKEIVRILKEKEHCEVVICMSHLGIQEDKTRLATETKDIDIILGGHSHTFMVDPLYLKNAVGKDVPVYHIGKNGCFMSHTVLTVAKNKKKK